MEKGILYLLCSAIILLAVVLTAHGLSDQFSRELQPRVIYVKVPVVVTPTTIPTATPAATLNTVKTVTPVK